MSQRIKALQIFLPTSTFGFSCQKINGDLICMEFVPCSVQSLGVLCWLFFHRNINHIVKPPVRKNIKAALSSSCVIVGCSKFLWVIVSFCNEFL